MLLIFFHCLEHVTRVNNEHVEHNLLAFSSVFSYDNKVVDFCQMDNKISGLICVKHGARRGFREITIDTEVAVC